MPADPPTPADPKPGSAPRTLRFSRRQRLTHALQYQRVYAGKASLVRGPVRVHGRPNDAGLTRLGLSVGRKVGTAVARNRLKRLIREAFRLEQRSLPKGLDLVVSLNPHRELALEDYRTLLRAAAEHIAAVWAKRGKNPT